MYYPFTATPPNQLSCSRALTVRMLKALREGDGHQVQTLRAERDQLRNDVLPSTTALPVAA